MQNLNRLEYFVAIVEEGSITAAARRMRISKAVVSKQLRLLESELETTLVVRNSRHMSLTETGRSFFEAARPAVAQANEAFEAVRQGSGRPTGTLRISAPLDFGMLYVAHIAARFATRFPEVEMDLDFSDRRVNLVEARFDITFRVGWLKDSSNIARKLTDFQQVAVGTPEFMQRFGEPEHPSDLADLPFVENRILHRPRNWRFRNRAGKEVEVDLAAGFEVKPTLAVKALMQAGRHFAILPDHCVMPELENGSAVQLLPDWTLPSGGIYAVFPPTSFRSVAVKEFVRQISDHLRAAFP